MARFTIYLHTAPSGRSYVGFTSQTVEQRWVQHCYDAARGRYNSSLHAAIRKYGSEAFTTRVLDVVSTLVGAQKAERAWIRELSTRSPNGYNLTDGGDGAPNPTPEVRARMAAGAARSWTDPVVRASRVSASTPERGNASAYVCG